MSLPSVERHFRRAVGELASSKWSHFARREGWRCSTGSSVPPGCAVAPKRTKRAAARSRGTELGQQTHRSSRGVRACVASFPHANRMVFVGDADLQGSKPFCFFIFFKPAVCAQIVLVFQHGLHKTHACAHANLLGSLCRLSRTARDSVVAWTRHAHAENVSADSISVSTSKL